MNSLYLSQAIPLLHISVIFSIPILFEMRWSRNFKKKMLFSSVILRTSDGVAISIKAIPIFHLRCESDGLSGRKLRLFIVRKHVQISVA